MSAWEVVMTDLHLWRPTHGGVEDMRGIVPEEKNYAIGWTLSAVLTGGCGAAAKSCDEIGRLGAKLIVDGAIGDEGYDADFKPVFSM